MTLLWWWVSKAWTTNQHQPFYNKTYRISCCEQQPKCFGSKLAKIHRWYVEECGNAIALNYFTASQPPSRNITQHCIICHKLYRQSAELCSHHVGVGKPRWAIGINFVPLSHTNSIRRRIVRNGSILFSLLAFSLSFRKPNESFHELQLIEL